MVATGRMLWSATLGVVVWEGLGGGFRAVASAEAVWNLHPQQVWGVWQGCGAGDAVPDFTLPLVDMAEMDRPVMVVTVTDIRMMSHVRAVWERTDGTHWLGAASRPVPTCTQVFWAAGSRVPSSPHPARAPTNSCLGRDPGQAQVEDHSPDVQHAADLEGTEMGTSSVSTGGTWGQPGPPWLCWSSG